MLNAVSSTKLYHELNLTEKKLEDGIYVPRGVPPTSVKLLIYSYLVK